MTLVVARSDEARELKLFERTDHASTRHEAFVENREQLWGQYHISNAETLPKLRVKVFI